MEVEGDGLSAGPTLLTADISPSCTVVSQAVSFLSPHGKGEPETQPYAVGSVRHLKERRTVSPRNEEILGFNLQH